VTQHDSQTDPVRDAETEASVIPPPDSSPTPSNAAENGNGTRAVEIPAPPVADAATESESPSSEAAPQSPAAETPTTEPAAESTDGETAGPSAPDKPESGQAPRAAKSKRKPTPPRSASLYRAYRSHRPIEGRVERVIKGGYEVRVGRARGFCPHSHMDLKRVEDPESYVGKGFPFLITQIRRGGADVVLSRRVLLEDQRSEEAKAVRATLIEGAVMQGHVAGLAGFGAFVDLGAGVMGLVHASELSHSHVTKIEDVVQVGQSVCVKILRLDEAAGRISLSVRQATEDPWASSAERFEVGKVYPGIIRRLAEFGAFVEVAPGVEGLAPASEFEPSHLGWIEGLEVGTSRDWVVLSVNPGQRRISLALPGTGDAPNVEVGASLKGKVQRIERFGVFVWLGPGRVGLMPNVLTGTPPGSDLSRRFPVADEVEVDVVEIAEDGRRIRLARKGVQAPSRATPTDRSRPPRKPRRESRRQPEPREQQPTPAAEGEAFGTNLADKLRAALGQTEGK